MMVASTKERQMITIFFSTRLYSTMKANSRPDFTTYTNTHDQEVTTSHTAYSSNIPGLCFRNSKAPHPRQRTTSSPFHPVYTVEWLPYIQAGAMWVFSDLAHKKLSHKPSFSSPSMTPWWVILKMVGLRDRGIQDRMTQVFKSPFGGQQPRRAPQ